MTKRIFNTEEILIACIAYYAEKERDNYNASVEAKFFEDENGEICIELDVTEEDPLPSSDKMKVLN